MPDQTTRNAPVDNRVRVQIFDRDGRCVTDELVEAYTLTNDQSREVIDMISAGWTASAAVTVVLAKPSS